MEEGEARRWAVTLAAGAAWAALVPPLGRAVGLRLDVPARLEVADHVVPGLVALASALVLAAGARPVRPGDVRWSVAAGAASLAGFWIAATHVPLIGEALDGVTGWGPALLHLSAAVPVTVTAVAMLLVALRHPGPG